jgi:hypothetical protein
MVLSLFTARYTGMDPGIGSTSLPMLITSDAYKLTLSLFYRYILLSLSQLNRLFSALSLYYNHSLATIGERGRGTIMIITPLSLYAFFWK